MKEHPSIYGARNDWTYKDGFITQKTIGSPRRIIRVWENFDFERFASITHIRDNGYFKDDTLVLFENCPEPKGPIVSATYQYRRSCARAYLSDVVYFTIRNGRRDIARDYKPEIIFQAYLVGGKEFKCVHGLTGLVCFDLDDLGFRGVDRVLDQLSQMNMRLMAFPSYSGKGLKIIVGASIKGIDQFGPPILPNTIGANKKLVEWQKAVRMHYSAMYRKIGQGLSEYLSLPFSSKKGPRIDSQGASLNHTQGVRGTDRILIVSPQKVASHGNPR